LVLVCKGGYRNSKQRVNDLKENQIEAVFNKVNKSQPKETKMTMTITIIPSSLPNQNLAWLPNRTNNK
jgi:hypothetical protein